MKKFMCLALTAALLFTGCTGKSDGESAGTAGQAESSTVQETTSPSETTQAATQTAEEETQTQTSSEAGSMKAGVYSYHLETEEKSWSTQKGQLACTVKIQYPVFEGDTEGEKKINEFYQEWISGKMEDYETDPESIVGYALQYRTEEENAQTSETQETETFTMPPSEEDFTVGGVVARDNIISVFHESYTYEGGAHGMPGRLNFLFDSETGKELTLSGLINKSGDELNTLVRGKFLELVEKDTENRFFEDAAETLNAKTDFIDSYYLNEEGVVFYSSPYEIAPYAAGYTEVTIPYADLGM